jgi:alpha-D-ribose 1-methylphosphonate 5-triphosphate synthase subunit PhnL
VASLDAENRDAVFDVIGSLASQGVAVLAVFHDAEAIERLATRGVYLTNGRLNAAPMMAHAG